MATFVDVYEQLCEQYPDERDRGRAFERLVADVLRTDPVYQSRFSNVWPWSEYPHRDGGDIGIDIVAELRDGGFAAIQCKCQVRLDKHHIDSFLADSQRSLSGQNYVERYIFTTATDWSSNAERAITKIDPPVQRVDLSGLDGASINWDAYLRDTSAPLQEIPQKQLRPHQETAVDDVLNGFQTNDRGKLIMACGTGKTLTALRIAEEIAGKGGRVLFAAPSISLLSQSMREWGGDAKARLRSFAVCSEIKMGRDDGDSARTYDMPIPATTNAEALVAAATPDAPERMTVVFTTYHSMQVVSDAQKAGMPDFDLVICDEAHRTTGSGSLLNAKDRSAFMLIHDENAVKSAKRLYMTATPRIYKEHIKEKAKENEVYLASMDNERIYGPEFHRLSFSDAVDADLLTDYKVVVLAVSETQIAREYQHLLSEGEELGDVGRVIGCLNGLAKVDPENKEFKDDPLPMNRAVAFSNTIGNSKHFIDLVEREQDEAALNIRKLKIEGQHVDGKTGLPKRNKALQWLRSDMTMAQQCNVLSNARCLTEGIDVPALDAILFLQPRKSYIDVVQAVGRVMRKAEGKKYGYIILPIIVPSGVVDAESALDNNAAYSHVWQVLQALRAHDERFDVYVNQLDLNKKNSGRITVIGVGSRSELIDEVGSAEPVVEGEQEVISPVVAAADVSTGSAVIAGDVGDDPAPEKTEVVAGTGVASDVTGTNGVVDERGWQHGFDFDIEGIRKGILGQTVKRCGERRYWEKWADSVAEIAQHHHARIRALVDAKEGDVAPHFAQFVNALRQNLNDSVTDEKAMDMLSQHMLTKPVFDALFGGQHFTESNPVSRVMQTMIEALEGYGLEAETEELAGFYESVRKRVEGIDNAEGKQRVVNELYERFFKVAYPKDADLLGIAYTPVPIVDFIIRSVQDLLQQDFGVSLSDEGVHILDPFVGTGTFITRMLQSGFVDKETLLRKYAKELHANELMLLAYYIAAVNIETTFAEMSGEYQPFGGIVLTDTFQASEASHRRDTSFFPRNNARMEKQLAKDIRVIIGNPPWSRGQGSHEDDNRNQSYPTLDAGIADSYIAQSQSKGLMNPLYDSYVRAIRWASDRVQTGDGGVVAYVTNNGFLDGKSFDGFRKTVAQEFDAVYVYNLRGNLRAQDEALRKEGESAFGSATRTGVAMLFLVNKPTGGADRRSRQAEPTGGADRRSRQAEPTGRQYTLPRYWRPPHTRTETEYTTKSQSCRNRLADNHAKRTHRLDQSTQRTLRKPASSIHHSERKVYSF